ncbi:hypothetical protein CB1_000399002 [Camelus ferus]|nr:hypothetical protein CB1_000399002 [Camelus ferus]
MNSPQLHESIGVDPCCYAEEEKEGKKMQSPVCSFSTRGEKNLGTEQEETLKVLKKELSTIVSPLLNPFVYCLRNELVQKVSRDLLIKVGGVPSKTLRA